jgi:hypothetical protein
MTSANNFLERIRLQVFGEQTHPDDREWAYELIKDVLSAAQEVYGEALVDSETQR